MKYKRAVSILIFLINFSLYVNPGISQELQNSGFNKIYPYALRGEMVKVFDLLNSFQAKDLNSKEKTIKARFFKRFIDKTEIYDYKTNQKPVIKLIVLFHNYWISVMLNKQSLKIADSVFTDSLSFYLYNVYYAQKGIMPSIIKNDLSKYCTEFIESYGYFSNACGKTGQFFDLFIWKGQEKKVYPIRLINDSVNVSVIFMKDFISRGWEYYSTLGRSYVGGWATNTSLFAFDESYNRESEKFRISYLCHEGQHFSDYKNFPKLKQTDLEYRAKLVELAKSEKSTYDLIKIFIAHSYAQKGNAHAFADYCLIRDLSNLIFKNDFEDDINKWLKVSQKTIREKSVELFKKNTRQLIKLGSKSVESLIN